LEDPGRFLKGIYDIGLPLKFIVSGSSSLEVRSKVFESLVGRKRVFYLWPFSFKEYLSSQSPPLELPAMDAEVSFILPYELESIDITSGTTY